MKQIRPRIFETNSSTTHSLTIARNKVTPEIIDEFKKEHGTHIVFGLNPYEEIEKILHKNLRVDENTTFQIRADILYFSMYVWDENRRVAEFLYHKSLLTEKLTELGFTVEFREDPEVLKEYDWHDHDIGENLFECLWHGDYIEEVIDYLFSNHVLYYTWCTECRSEVPEDIREAEDRFQEYSKTEELKNYNDWG